MHGEMNDCGHEGEGQERQVFWRGQCECGWTGKQHFGHINAATLAARDYRSHVEDAMGVADAYYDADVACRNCGSRHQQGIVVGTHVTSGTCTRCSTRMLEPNNEAWHDAGERMKGWR